MKRGVAGRDVGRWNRYWVALVAIPMTLAVWALPSSAAQSPGNDNCGYPASSFGEPSVLRWAQINGVGLTGTISAFANDEKGLLLGVDGATRNVANPQHASNASGGDPSRTDPSGRPYFPALYITNLTAHPSSSGTGAGDFQNGGLPRNVGPAGPFIDDVFGTWATATDSGGHYRAQAPVGKNNWNLGDGSDAPVGTTFSAMQSEGYGAEVRWNSSHLTDSDGRPLAPGHTYRIQFIVHDGDQNKTGGDAAEFCTTLAIPAITTVATSGTVGHPVHDQTTVTGSNGASGTLSWRVYSGPGCNGPATQLAGMPITGDGTYSSPDFTPATAGSYQWVATYASPTLGTISTACGDGGEVSHVGNPPAPGIRLVKLEGLVASRSLTHGPLTGNVGDVVTYQTTVTNTGNTPLALAFSDTSCTGLSGPLVLGGAYDPASSTLSAGGELRYTCSHVLTAADAIGFENTASVLGTAPDGTAVGPSTDSVVAYAASPAIRVLKLQSLNVSGPFISPMLTAQIGQKIYYEVQVTNAGATDLALTLSDPGCDSGTVAGPSLLTGTLTGTTLSPNSTAQYTCTHVLTTTDALPFTNTATVTGQPPSGPPVGGSSSVTAAKGHVSPVHVCRTPGGRVIRYHGGTKPRACKKRIPHRPKKPHGFTG